MSISKFNPRTTVLLVITALAAGLRLTVSFNTEHNPISVFTPIGAMAIFGGAYFMGKFKPIAFPLLALFISDVVLTFTVYSEHRSGLLYEGWYWVYMAFALMTIAGKIILKNINFRTVIFATITATLIHWLISDIAGCLRTENSQGFFTIYVQRLITAIPYEFRFLAATAIYSAIMFGSFEWLQMKKPLLRVAS